MARCLAHRPASTVAGPQPYAPAVALNDQPVAVVLDLMKSSGGDPIEGSSYRFRQHADLMPENVRSKRSSIPQSRRSRRDAAVDRQKMELPITLPADHPLQLGNFTSAHLGAFESALTATARCGTDN